MDMLWSGCATSIQVGKRQAQFLDASREAWLGQLAYFCYCVFSCHTCVLPPCLLRLEFLLHISAKSGSCQCAQFRHLAGLVSRGWLPSACVGTMICICHVLQASSHGYDVLHVLQVDNSSPVAFSRKVMLQVMMTMQRPSRMWGSLHSLQYYPQLCWVCTI